MGLRMTAFASRSVVVERLEGRALFDVTLSGAYLDEYGQEGHAHDADLAITVSTTSGPQQFTLSLEGTSTSPNGGSATGHISWVEEIEGEIWGTTGWDVVYTNNLDGTYNIGIYAYMNAESLDQTILLSPWVSQGDNDITWSAAFTYSDASWDISGTVSLDGQGNMGFDVLIEWTA